MYRYVAFLRTTHGSHNDGSAPPLADQFRHNHPTWKPLRAGTGIFLFHLPPAGRSLAAIELPAGSGAILGTLFPKDLETSPRDWNPAIDEKIAREIVRTRGRHLIDNYWGGYVAFLSDHGRGQYGLGGSSARMPVSA